MYGPEYLDWKSECAAAEAIDDFLAAMEPEDRKWALAVLRKRHTVYRDGPSLGALARQNLLSGPNALQQAALRQSTNYSPVAGLFGNIFGL